MQFFYIAMLLAPFVAALPPKEGTSPNVLSLRAVPPSDDGATFKDSTGRTISCYGACYSNWCAGFGFEDVCMRLFN